MRLAKAELDATARDFKVLVADDSPIYRKLVEHALAEKQYAVLFAKSGREAIDLFSEHQPWEPMPVLTSCSVLLSESSPSIQRFNCDAILWINPRSHHIRIPPNRYKTNRMIRTSPTIPIRMSG
jgi:hypothetical protein